MKSLNQLTGELFDRMDEARHAPYEQALPEGYVAIVRLQQTVGNGNDGEVQEVNLPCSCNSPPTLFWDRFRSSASSSPHGLQLCHWIDILGHKSHATSTLWNLDRHNARTCRQVAPVQATHAAPSEVQRIDHITLFDYVLDAYMLL